MSYAVYNADAVEFLTGTFPSIGEACAFVRDNMNIHAPNEVVLCNSKRHDQLQTLIDDHHKGVN